MGYEDYMTVIRPRVHGLWNLHNILVSKSHDLDFWINLSSVAGTTGNPTQAAYTATGTFMAAFAKYRTTTGLPCTTIDLPVVADVGYIVRDPKTQDQVTAVFGHLQVDINDIQRLISAAVGGDMERTCNNHSIMGLSQTREIAARDGLSWARDPRFSHLLRQQSTAKTEDTSLKINTTPQTSLADTIKTLQSLSELYTVITDAFVQKMSSILIMAAEHFDRNKPISAFGIDSLVAIEIRYWINRELHANLQLTEILEAESTNALAWVIIRQSGIVPESLKSA